MYRSSILAAAAATLTLFGSVAVAQTGPADKKDGGSLSSEPMPTEKGGGTTDKPTAKPADGSLSTGAQKDMPGTKGGSTDQPTAQPKDGSLQDGAKDDMGK